MAKTAFDAGIDEYLAARGEITLLPEPPAEDVFCPVISVDDHALEPLDLFERRVPAKYADAAPKVIRDEDGVPYWYVDGARIPILVTNGASGRPIAEWGAIPAKYEEFREAVWNPVKRLDDMDICGVWATLCFGSVPFGFAGSRFSAMDDADAGLAAVAARSDWMIEEWCAADPDRYIPCQLPWLRDPEIAAKEIRKNAERGFKAVSFSENPEALGFPSVYSDYWDPFFAACAETGTVVNLHVGSSGLSQKPSTVSPTDVWVALFPVSAIVSIVDWIYARIPMRFPDLKIAMSEGGASWVPMVIERLRRSYRQVESSTSWKASDPDPAEILHRNFWFCSIEDPAAFRLLDIIGEERVMLEMDYPHQDSSWPIMQALIRSQMGDLPGSIVRKICYENAAELYRHPLPPAAMIEASEVGATDDAVR